jgi:hypothetical protein
MCIPAYLKNKIKVISISCFLACLLQYKLSFLYSPSPEYPAACCSGAEIPPSGAAGMNGKMNRTTCLDGVLTKSEAHQSEGGLNLLNHFNAGMATAQFRFDTPQACRSEA